MYAPSFSMMKGGAAEMNCGCPIRIVLLRCGSFISMSIGILSRTRTRTFIRSMSVVLSFGVRVISTVLPSAAAFSVILLEADNALARFAVVGGFPSESVE